MQLQTLLARIQFATDYSFTVSVELSLIIHHYIDFCKPYFRQNYLNI